MYFCTLISHIVMIDINKFENLANEIIDNSTKNEMQSWFDSYRTDKALNFTQAVLKNMLEQGLASDKYTFSLCKTIQDKFGATENDALIIIETSLSNI